MAKHIISAEERLISRIGVLRDTDPDLYEALTAVGKNLSDLTIEANTAPVGDINALAKKDNPNPVEDYIALYCYNKKGNKKVLLRNLPVHIDRLASYSFFDDFNASSAANPAAGSAQGFGDHASANFITDAALGQIFHSVGPANHPGTVYFIVGTATNNKVSALYANRVVYPLSLDKGLKRFGVGLRNPGAAASAQYDEIRIQLGPTVSTKANDMIGFEELGNADTNWFAITRLSSSETRTDTGIACTGGANVWHDFEVDVSDNGRIKFYIDGILVAEHTTHIIAATLDTQLSVQYIFHTSGDASALIVVDYWYWDQDPAREF